MEYRWQDVEHYLRRAFADRLHQHEAGQPLPELDRVVIVGERPHTGQASILLRFRVGSEREHRRIVIHDAHDICSRFWNMFRRQRPVRSDGVLYDARSLWSEMVEDHLVELEIRLARNQLDEIMRVTFDRDICRSAQEQYHHRVDMIRRTHYQNREPATYDFWSDGPRDGRRQNARIVDGQHRAQQMQQLMQTMQTVQIQTPNPLLQTPVNYDALFQRYFENLTGGWSEMMGVSPEAEKKGMDLFKAHLTPAQLATYETSSYIEVKGGVTGKTYRIHHGRQMNIRVLDKTGKEASGLCFLPQGNLVVGDVMLGQKMALELYEEKALRVANHFGPNGTWTNGGWSEFELQDTANRMLTAVEADERARNNWQSVRDVWSNVFRGI